MVLYLASDLIWSTRIKATAVDAGVPARPVRNLEMLEARLADELVRGVILDLEAGQAAFDLLGRLRGPGASDQERRIRVLAFGPHHDREALQAAREGGADEVLPRGAFDHALGEILVRLEAGSRP